jgi:hypothetical protein
VPTQTPWIATKEVGLNQQNPARVYVGVVGVVLVAAGIIGFFYSSDFGAPGKVDAVLGILDVNAWHNIVHLATGGLALLAFAAGADASRAYALAFGVIYLIVAAWGFIIGSGDSILGIIPINTEDSVLHLLLGIGGVAAAAATPAIGERPAVA